MPMALVKDKDVRLRLRIESAASFSDDVANLGRMVPPRGPGRRAEHREDYCLRQLLIAMFKIDCLDLPLTVEARRADNKNYPDFVVNFDNGNVLGIEHTDAGSATWQERQSTVAAPDDQAELYAGFSYAGDRPERIVVNDISEAVVRKVRKANSGAYSAVPQCDLLIYENSEGGIFVNPSQIARRLIAAQRDDDIVVEPFTRIHLIIGKVVIVDLFGRDRRDFDVSTEYSEDWVGWLRAQAKLIREGRKSEIDADSIAEELEALARKDRRTLLSQLRRLLLHLIKMQFQPMRSGRSWERSVTSARQAIEGIIEDSPSLESLLPELLAKAYDKVRRDAARETRLDIGVFPTECPFNVDQLFDEDYFPGAEK